MSKTVITYGTFDLFHFGHYNLLKRASELGDSLIVGISSDEFCYEKKGKFPYFPKQKRIEMVSDLRFVDKVILETSLAQKVDDVRLYGINVFCLGDDYREIFPKMDEYGKLLELGCEVIFLERTPGVSSSILRQLLNASAYRPGAGED